MYSISFKILSMTVATSCFFLFGNTITTITEESISDRLNSEIQSKSETAIYIINSELKHLEEVIEVSSSEVTFRDTDGHVHTIFKEEGCLGVYNELKKTKNYLDLSVEKLEFKFDSSTEKLSVKVNTSIEVKYNRDETIVYNGYSEKGFSL